MKRNHFYFVSLLLVFLVSFAACSKDKDEPEKDDPDVDKEYMAICKKAANVHQQILEISGECNSIEELEEQQAKIWKIDGVEDVYFSGLSMFIDIKDFRTISYSFYPEPVNEEAPEDFVKQMQDMETRMTRSEDAGHPFSELKNAALVNQQFKDESRPYAKAIINEANKMFQAYEEYGFRPKVVNNFSLSFLEDDIWKYDIIFILTHGGYDSRKNLHWLVTSEELNEENDNISFDRFSYSYKEYPEDEVSFDCKLKETRNGAVTSIVYAKISDKFIENLNGKFEKGAIVFNSACTSMKGSNPNTADSISYRLADAFIDKGAAAYFGFDETNSIARFSNLYLMQRIISGMSFKNAFDDIPSGWRHEFKQDKDKDGNVVRTYWADLQARYNLAIDGVEKSCVTKPILSTPNPESDENKIFVTLKAHSLLYLEEMVKTSDTWKDYTYELQPYYSKNPLIRYGFDLSEYDNFRDVRSFNSAIGQENCVFSNDMVNYTCTLEYKYGDISQIKPNTHYYVRAYFYDGYSKYFSDTMDFTTPMPKNTNINGDGTLPDVPGTDF